MLLLRMQEIQDETTKATRVNHVTAANNRYMESVTNVKIAETRYVKAVFFGVRHQAWMRFQICETCQAAGNHLQKKGKVWKCSWCHG